MQLSLLTLAVCALAETKRYWQDTDEAYNILKYASGSGPYIKGTGYGIDPAIMPDTISVDMAIMFSRHGERYPEGSTARHLNDTYTKLKTANASYTGPLAFVKDWEFFVEDEALLGLETNTSRFSGIADLYDMGYKMRMQYSDLYDESTTLAVFASGYRRVVDSANAFTLGFLQGLPASSSKLNVIPEEYIMGRNTLTMETSCLNFTEYETDAEYNRTFMEQEAERLNKLSPGFNITALDVYELTTYCFYELNARGHSEACDSVSWNAFVEREYLSDHDTWYDDAHTPYSFTMGAVFANATATLLTEDPARHNNQSLWFSFTHDTDLAYLANALGILDYQKDDLPSDRIEFGRFFRTEQLIPMAGHIVIERLTDSETDEKYVRVVINEAVIPLPDCQDGPFATCKLSTFTAQLQAKINEVGSYDEICGGNETVVPEELSYFWDWQTAGYASDI